MKSIARSLSSLLVLAGLVVPTLAAASVSGGNPYQSVVDRNVFDLRPLIPPPKAEETQQAHPAKIELQGITDGIFGKRQALVRILEPPKPGEQPKPRSLIMDEGERRGLVTVKAINPKARTVTFDNAGQEETLELTNAPSKLVGPVAPGGVPSPIPMPAKPQANALAVPQNMAPPGSLPALKPGGSLPKRQLRVVTSASGGAAIPGARAAGGIPTGGVPAAGTANAPQPQPTLEEQIVMLEVNRERHKEAVARGELPPLPPSPLTPPAEPTAPGNN